MRGGNHGSKVDLLPKEFYRTETKYFPIAKAIESYMEGGNPLPEGIIGNERKKPFRIAFTKGRGEEID